MAKPGSKIFHDPIHGTMEFESVLVKIIDTPEFQRLRRIKQLGGGCYVYPGATHTRFEHSLGVCHLAGKFAEHLNEAAKKDNPGKELITADEILCIKVAALCHDLGHGPFSHMFEVFANKVLCGEKWEHEEMSEKILGKILEDAKDILKDEDEDKKLLETLIAKKDFIGSLIKGSKEQTSKKHFLYQIVANKDTGVDVDKWDYFARDCHYLGLSNDFQWMRCMMLARVKEVKPGDYQVCYRDSDIANIYAMFRTRSTLHQKVYQHIRVKAVEQMMIDCLYHMKKCTPPRLQENLEDIIKKRNYAEFAKLDDSIVESLQKPVDGNEGEKKAFEVIDKLRRRMLYCYVGFAKTKAKSLIGQSSTGQIGQSSTGQSLTEQSIREKLKIPDHFAISVAKVKFGSEEESPIQELWFYPKDGQPFQLSGARSKQIPLGGLLLPLEHDKLRREVRFYCKKDHNHKSCVEDIKSLLKSKAAIMVFGEPTKEDYKCFSMTDGK